MLASAGDELSESDAKILMEETKILQRNYLFETPQPSFKEVVEKFWKWLRYVSFVLLTTPFY